MTDYLKSILNAFHDLLFVFTSDGIIEDYITSNHEDELILPKEAFLGNHFEDILPQQVSKKIKRAFLEIDQGQQKYMFDYSIELKGEKQWYNAVLSKIDIGDEPRYLGAVRNITARKNQELLLRGILNNSPGGILVLQAVRDSEDRIIEFEITHANKSVEILTGATEKELVGQKISSIVEDSAKEIMMEKFRSVVETENPVEFQYQHKNEKGEVFWYHSKIAKYRDGVVSTFMDITKQKKTEDDLAGKNEELQELNRQKDKLFSVISHDLRNAVGGTKGVYDILMKDYQDLSKDEIFEYLQILSSSSKNTFELMENLLVWSRNQFQEITMDIEKINLANLTESIFDMVRSYAENKGINLKNQVQVAAFVHADANMINTILRNLVTNAIKFSNPGDEVVVQSEVLDDEVKISVIDEGVGIEKKAIEKVLNKKITYTTSGTNGEKGSGLGLDLCLDFAEMLGSSIKVESEPGKGSTFTVSIPIHPVN